MRNLLQSLPGNSRSSLDYSPDLPTHWVILHCCYEFLLLSSSASWAAVVTLLWSRVELWFWLSASVCLWLLVPQSVAYFVPPSNDLVVLCRLWASALLECSQVVHVSFDSGIPVYVGFSNNGLSSSWHYGSPPAFSLVYR